MVTENKDLDKITNKDKYNNLLEDVTKGNTSKFIATFRELFEELVDDMGYKAVVVYIDDLDRCEPKRIIGCLEAVKLFVNVRKTAFIIGADERIIEYAISQHYPIQMKKEDISSPFQIIWKNSFNYHTNCHVCLTTSKRLISHFFYAKSFKSYLL